MCSLPKCSTSNKCQKCGLGEVLQRENLMKGKTDLVEIAPLCGKLHVEGEEWDPVASNVVL